MLEGVDRLIDLAGPRTTALSGASEDDVIAAVGRCDAAALGATDGHFAVTARDGKTVRLARTIGIPLRYFVAKMYHGPFLVVAERMDQIFAWCREQKIAWQFDPAYTRMVPAHHIVELDQVGCPDPAPRYHRFFDPPVGLGSTDVGEAGAAYIATAYESVLRWMKTVPGDEPVAVAFSGGVDSTAVLLMAVRANAAIGGSPDRIRAFTLDLGGGRDAEQAERVVRDLGLEGQWERIVASPEDIDLEAAIRLIEDYHPLDVECAATAVVSAARRPRAIPASDTPARRRRRRREPQVVSARGLGSDALQHPAQPAAVSGGLGRRCHQAQPRVLGRSLARLRAHVRACGGARIHAFSPFTTRSVIAAAVAIPFEQVLAGDASRLNTLKQDVVSAGVQATLGVDMPVNQKRRFQDGAAAMPRERVSKAWCRRTFNRLWQDRQREADSGDRADASEQIEVVPAGANSR